MFGWFSNKPKSKAEQRQRDYEALGKQVMVLYDYINPDRKGLYRTAFLKGIITGVGGVIGATLVIALLAWLLSLGHHVPLLGPITDNIRQTIQDRPSP
jgi:hypothetical protein